MYSDVSPFYLLALAGKFRVSPADHQLEEGWADADPATGVILR
jgi:hypothetical protein